MRIVVCGGRTFKDYWRLCTTLDQINEMQGISDLAHGNALGADTLAGMWAICNGIIPKDYNANWDRFGDAAGPIRNGEMLRVFKPDAVVAFPGGRGTADCVKQAEKLGIRVILV